MTTNLCSSNPRGPSTGKSINPQFLVGSVAGLLWFGVPSPHDALDTLCRFKNTKFAVEKRELSVGNDRFVAQSFDECNVERNVVCTVVGSSLTLSVPEAFYAFDGIPLQINTIPICKYHTNLQIQPYRARLNLQIDRLLKEIVYMRR